MILKSANETVKTYGFPEIMEYDNQLIDTVEKEKNAMEVAKQNLDKSTEEMKTIKLKVEQNQNICQNAKTLQQSYMAQLSEKELKLKDHQFPSGLKNTLTIFSLQV